MVTRKTQQAITYPYIDRELNPFSLEDHTTVLQNLSVPRINSRANFSTYSGQNRESLFSAMRYYYLNEVKTVAVCPYYAGYSVDVYLHRNPQNTFAINNEGFLFPKSILNKFLATDEWSIIYDYIDWDASLCVVIEAKIVPYSYVSNCYPMHPLYCAQYMKYNDRHLLHNQGRLDIVKYTDTPLYAFYNSFKGSREDLMSAIGPRNFYELFKLSVTGSMLSENDINQYSPLSIIGVRHKFQRDDSEAELIPTLLSFRITHAGHIVPYTLNESVSISNNVGANYCPTILVDVQNMVTRVSDSLDSDSLGETFEFRTINSTVETYYDLPYVIGSVVRYVPQGKLVVGDFPKEKSSKIILPYILCRHNTYLQALTCETASTYFLTNSSFLENYRRGTRVQFASWYMNFEKGHFLSSGSLINSKVFKDLIYANTLMTGDISYY